MKSNYTTEGKSVDEFNTSKKHKQNLYSYVLDTNNYAVHYTQNQWRCHGCIFIS